MRWVVLSACLWGGQKDPVLGTIGSTPRTAPSQVSGTPPSLHMNFRQTQKGKSQCRASHIRPDLQKRWGQRSGLPRPFLWALHPCPARTPIHALSGAFSLHLPPHSNAGLALTLLPLRPLSSPSCFLLLSRQRAEPPHCLPSAHFSSPGALGPVDAASWAVSSPASLVGSCPSTRHLSSSVLKTHLTLTSHLLGGPDSTRPSSVQALWAVTWGSPAPRLHSACSWPVQPSP